MPVLGLGLMVTGGIVTAAAFTVPGPVDGIASAGAEHAAAGAGKPADPGNQGNTHPGNQGNTDPGNQGNPPGQSGQAGQGNTNPGGDTSGQNDPGTNPAGHANGGTGTGTDPGTEPGLGSGMLVELRVTTSGDVPPDLDASGAEFAFSDATDGTPAGTCVTGVAGTCTVLLGPELVTGGGGVLMLADGTYEVAQTEAAPGLAPAPGVIGTFSLCSCEQTLSVPVTNASLFRTRVLATVLDDAGNPVANREFSLTGQGRDAGAATSDAVGALSFDGWFAPDSWTFTPTTPAGFADAARAAAHAEHDAGRGRRPVGRRAPGCRPGAHSGRGD